MAEDPKEGARPGTESRSPDGLERALSGLAGAVKLDWVRPLIWRLGGRKTAVLAPLAAVVTKLVCETPGAFDVSRGVAVAGIWIGAGVMSLAVGLEDSRRDAE